jgi:hypothetical protein
VCKFNGVLVTLSTGKFKMARDLDFFFFQKKFMIYISTIGLFDQMVVMFPAEAY